MANPFKRFAKKRPNFRFAPGSSRFHADEDFDPEDLYYDPQDSYSPFDKPGMDYAYDGVPSPDRAAYSRILESEEGFVNFDGAPYVRKAEFDILSVNQIDLIRNLLCDASFGMDTAEKQHVVNIFEELSALIPSALKNAQGKTPGADDRKNAEGRFDREPDNDSWPDFGEPDLFYSHSAREECRGQAEDETGDAPLPLWLTEAFAFFEKFIRNKKPDGVWLALEILSCAVFDEDFLTQPDKRITHLNMIRDLDALFEMEALLNVKQNKGCVLLSEHAEAQRHLETREFSQAGEEVLSSIRRMCDEISALVDKNHEDIRFLEMLILAKKKEYFEGCLTLMLQNDPDGAKTRNAHAVFSGESKKRTILRLPAQFGE